MPALAGDRCSGRLASVLLPAAEEVASQGFASHPLAVSLDTTPASATWWDAGCGSISK